MNVKNIERGKENRALVRKLLQEYLGISRTEIMQKTGLGAMTVSRHVAAIRAEWGADTLPTRRGKGK